MSVGRFSQLAASSRFQGNYGERSKIFPQLPPCQGDNAASEITAEFWSEED